MLQGCDVLKQSSMLKAEMLFQHRRRIGDNPAAYTHELRDEQIQRLVKTLKNHLRGSNLRRGVSFEPFLAQAIRLIHQSQGGFPILHVPGDGLPFCWNAPKNWNLNFIKYEWGHLQSINQAPEESSSIENLGLYSARCNQHIQTSMNFDEIGAYGGLLEKRVQEVGESRRRLFRSQEWKDLIQHLTRPE